MTEMSTTITRVGINGAAGRMGQRLIALGYADPEIQVVSAVEHPEHSRLGEDAGRIAGIGEIGVRIGTQLDPVLDAVIDFSVPEGSAAVLKACLERSKPLVLATTGLPKEFRSKLDDAARRIPVLFSPNMSLAVNLAMKLATIAARSLARYGPGVDVEIIERHHRFKEDAPSGTALGFGDLIAQVMGQTSHVHGRSGRPGPRPRGEIGYHALRVGDNPGEHTVVFGLMGESLELAVKATSRDSYALGALAAAKFVARQSPGLYSMCDVLGL
jgi:4-hydroxy-tetrahydrodipicolinate reductase